MVSRAEKSRKNGGFGESPFDPCSVPHGMAFPTSIPEGSSFEALSLARHVN